ncbi:MAG: hypothetical protein RL217_1738 [Pseudomonadota bacterium]|jgi:hypothetical protein
MAAKGRRYGKSDAINLDAQFENAQVLSGQP